MYTSMTKIDFHHVEDNHLAIHARLENWARWVKPGRQSWINPMFAQYRSKAWQWHTPEINVPLDTLDAIFIEKAVSALPETHRATVRWAYVIRSGPSTACRKIGTSMDGLMLYLRDGRQILIDQTARSASIGG